MKNLRLFMIMVVLIAVLFYGCKKEEEPAPVNPYNGRTFAIFNPDKSYGTLTDIDDNIYKTITIGTQTWMAENLRTTRYRNGDPIPQIKQDEAWAGLIAGGFCNFNNTENVDTIATFGRLYNWLTIDDSRGVAPQGWHVPTDEEWVTLINFLGGDSLAGGTMKEKEQPHWVIPDPYATNESGFTAMPAGMRDNSSGAFAFACTFWSSTAADFCSVWCRYLYVGQNGCYRYNPSKTYGFSIRCIKD